MIGRDGGPGGRFKDLDLLKIFTKLSKRIRRRKKMEGSERDERRVKRSIALCLEFKRLREVRCIGEWMTKSK